MRQFLESNLRTYRQMTPSLIQVEKLLGLGKYVPDHIAFRSFKRFGGARVLRKFLIEQDYEEMDHYDFPSKKLKASWFRPAPWNRHCFPRMFVSEIEDELLTRDAQQIIVNNFHQRPLKTGDFGGSQLLTEEDVVPPLCLTAQEFQQLKKESEYAAWTLIHGYRINHIAINMDDISAANNGWINTMEDLHNVLESQRFRLLCGPNGADKIKLSKDGMLAQSSILADPLETLLRVTHDKNMKTAVVVGGGFVEFIDRQRDGFEPENALQIFDSTTLGAASTMQEKQ